MRDFSFDPVVSTALRPGARGDGDGKPSQLGLSEKVPLLPWSVSAALTESREAPEATETADRHSSAGRRQFHCRHGLQASPINSQPSQHMLLVDTQSPRVLPHSGWHSPRDLSLAAAAAESAALHYYLNSFGNLTGQHNVRMAPHKLVRHAVV